MGDTDPVVHCTLAEAANLLAGLESAHIEHLDVDDERTIVIYQSAILMVSVTNGDATTARAFDVELWESPPHDSNQTAEEVLQRFVEELVASLPTTRQDS
ncbi:hypothetical protein [Halobacterium hubeiense]|uniref:hypothetical protein n=1 Tax=Halobacterium hubeiense TaxID=1407499 RepID=UPI000B7DDF16|nr:hypothetical protein [Halobacterium hubeiense]